MRWKMGKAWAVLFCLGKNDPTDRKTNFGASWSEAPAHQEIQVARRTTNTRVEHSTVRLEMETERLFRQEPSKPLSLSKQAAMALGTDVGFYDHCKICEVENKM